MKTYTVEEVLAGITNTTGIDFTVNKDLIEDKTEYMYLTLFSIAFHNTVSKPGWNVLINDLEKIVISFLNGIPRVPVGTFIPEGKELLLYEVYTENNVDRYEVFDSRDKFIKGCDAYEILDGLKSDKAAVINLKDMFIEQLTIKPKYLN